MYILDIDIGLALKVAYRSFCYSLCCDIYKLIINLYKLFEMLCNAVLIDNSVLSNIYHRIGLVLGVIMLFRVIFSFIKYLINPDELQDKEKGAFNLVKKIIVVIVMLGSVSYLFDFAYKIQKGLLSTEDGGNVVSRLLLPYNVNTDKFGAVFSENILFSFYSLNDETIGSDEYTICSNYIDKLRLNIENEYVEDFSIGFNCLDKVVEKSDAAGEKIDTFVIHYNGILSVVVGLLICWFLLTYCFSVGVRVVQLTFLQIIAPMPIISYLSPQKDGMFQKWGKMCITTYLDVFIRVAIINFIVLLIGIIMDSFESFNSVFWASTGAGLGNRGFLRVIIILALLQFAKKAPELIKELLPKSWAASGDFGFGLKNRDVLGRSLSTVGGITAGAAVGAVSGFSGGKGLSKLSGIVTGALGGAGRGTIGGLKSKGQSFGDIGKNFTGTWKKQSEAGMKRAERIFNGGSWLALTGDKASAGMGFMSTDYKLESIVNTQDQLEAELDKDKSIKSIVAAMNNLQLGQTFTDHNGKTRTLNSQADIDAAYADLNDQKKVARAKVLKTYMENPDDSTVKTIANRLAREDSGAKIMMKKVKEATTYNEFYSRYKIFSDANDNRKATIEKRKINRGKK